MRVRVTNQLHVFEGAVEMPAVTRQFFVEFEPQTMAEPFEALPLDVLAQMQRHLAELDAAYAARSKAMHAELDAIERSHYEPSLFSEAWAA